MDLQILQGRTTRVMKIPTERAKEMEIGTSRDAKMESSIVNSMRRYFQTGSEKPRQGLEYAIIASVNRYFERPIQ
jgi:hypothetical protein